MTELPSIQDGGQSEFIDGLDDDFTDYSHHRKYDAVIRGYLTQDDKYKRLRHPETRDDYKALVVLVVSEYPPLRNRNLLEYYSDLVEREYTGAKVNDLLWEEFKRMVDICLDHGRFRNVRGLGQFYMNNAFLKSYVKKIRWDKVAIYYFPKNCEADWEMDTED